MPGIIGGFVGALIGALVGGLIDKKGYEKTIYHCNNCGHDFSNRGVAIAKKYANKKWVKRQKSTFRGFVYYYLGRVRDQVFLFFHPSEFFDYKRKKELDKYDDFNPNQLYDGCVDGCFADLSVGCTYIFAIIIIVVAILLAAAHW